MGPKCAPHSHSLALGRSGAPGAVAISFPSHLEVEGDPTSLILTESLQHLRAYEAKQILFPTSGCKLLQARFLESTFPACSVLL